MVYDRDLIAAQQFMTRELLSFEDELFSLLYVDIGDFASKSSQKVVTQHRRIAIYGTRGVGKTTAMQGVLWKTVSTAKDTKVVPITAEVKGARATTNLKELEDNFYRSVISGVFNLTKFNRKEKLKELTKKYAPLTGRKITEGLSLLVPPLAFASDFAEKGIEWLVGRLKSPDIESLLSSTTIDMRYAAEALINRMEAEGAFPIFVIDELDKATSDTLLADFFDGNQSWFQGKSVILSLTYTFGESIKESTTSSIRRLATVETYQGITTQKDAEKIIRSRALLGVSQIHREVGTATRIVEEMLPPDTIKTMLNVSAPNAYLLLERAYEAIQNAIETKSRVVMPEHVFEEDAEIEIPTLMEYQILKELGKGMLSPTDMASRLDKHPQSIVRSLKKLMGKKWVTKVGFGKPSYYYLTPKGDAAARRYEKSV